MTKRYRKYLQAKRKLKGKMIRLTRKVKRLWGVWYGKFKDKAGKTV